MIRKNVIIRSIVGLFILVIDYMLILFSSYGNGSISFESLLYSVTRRFASEFEYKEVKLKPYRSILG